MSETQKNVSEFMEFVNGELDRLAESAADKEQMEKIREAIIPLCEQFEDMCNGRINGAKSKIVLRLFAKLASWVPLTALTGEDDEWEKVSRFTEENGILYQNKRCPHVYKRTDGTCFDANGIVFSYDGRVWIRTKESNKDISFPYEVPVSPVRVRLDEEEKRS